MSCSKFFLRRRAIGLYQECRISRLRRTLSRIVPCGLASRCYWQRNTLSTLRIYCYRGIPKLQGLQRRESASTTRSRLYFVSVYERRLEMWGRRRRRSGVQFPCNFLTLNNQAFDQTIGRFSREQI